MSISSTNRKAGPYTGNGVTTALPFSFKVFSASDVLVVRTDLSGAETDLVLTTHYTVSLNADQDSNPGGIVNLVTPAATDYLTTIASAVPDLQPITLTNAGGFYPKVINDALDRVTIMVQQLAEKVSRAVKVGISEDTSPDQLLAAIYSAVSSAVSSSASAGLSAAAAALSAEEAAASALGVSPVANQINSATSKATPVDADEIGIADSAASYGIKKLAWGNVKAGMWSALGSLIMTGTGKATPVDADYIPLADSSAGNATKSLSWENVKATLKTYFDGLYSQIGLGYSQTWNDVTASRAISTDYTNNTGKPIEVSVSVTMVGGQGVQLTTDGGVVIDRASGNSATLIYQTLQGVIPDKKTYKVSHFTGSGATIDKWSELRA